MERDGIDSLLEMHLHGELPRSLRKKAEKLLATPEGKRRLEAIRESDRKILEELPPGVMAEAIRRKGMNPRSDAATKPRKSIHLGWAMPASVAALVLVVLVVRGTPSPKPSTSQMVGVDSNRSNSDTSRGNSSASVAATVDRAVGRLLGADSLAHVPKPEPSEVAMAKSDDDGIRTKGAALPRLRLHMKKAGGGVVGLRDGDTVPKAAILQVSLAKGPLLWAAVVSVDGSGQATLHLPEVGDSAAHLDEETAAPHSFQLDESPGFERFFLILSAHRFSLDEALALTRRSGVAVVAHKGWNIESIRVAKP